MGRWASVRDENLRANLRAFLYVLSWCAASFLLVDMSCCVYFCFLFVGVSDGWEERVDCCLGLADLPRIVEPAGRAACVRDGGRQMVGAPLSSNPEYIAS